MRTLARAVPLAILAAAALAADARAVAAQTKFSSGDADGGRHAMTLLGIPISPRAVALGEAMGTIDQDPATLWYNAAGLAGLTTNAFTVKAFVFSPARPAALYQRLPGSRSIEPMASPRATARGEIGMPRIVIELVPPSASPDANWAEAGDAAAATATASEIVLENRMRGRLTESP